MCVVKLGSRIKGPVIGWKLFKKDGNLLCGLVYDFFYEIGKIHTTTTGPGFQAFVTRKDALISKKECWERAVVKKVFLYNAAQGDIRGMDQDSDGKRGWAATKILIPRIKPT